MFYQTTKNYLKKSSKIEEFLQFASSKEPKEIIGLNDSVKSLLLAHLFFTNKKSILYITPNDTIAQNVCNDLEILLEEDKFFHLFSYELLPYEEFSPRPTCKLERSNTLTAATLNKKAIYITSLTELLRKINTPENFKKMISSLEMVRSMIWIRFWMSLSLPDIPEHPRLHRLENSANAVESSIFSLLSLKTHFVLNSLEMRSIQFAASPQKAKDQSLLITIL